jgi:peptide/nickel transport system permease protein
MKLRSFKRFNLTIGAVLVGLLVVTALLGLVYTPYDPTDVGHALCGARHPPLARYG